MSAVFCEFPEPINSNARISIPLLVVHVYIIMRMKKLKKIQRHRHVMPPFDLSFGICNSSFTREKNLTVTEKISDTSNNPIGSKPAVMVVRRKHKIWK